MTCHVIPQCVTNANYSETEKTCHSAASSEAEKREIDNCMARPRPSWLGRYFERVSPGRVTQPRTAPSQPSPAQPRPHFPNFPRQECGLASPGQPGTITIPHTASHRLTRSVRWPMQPPQRIKQFSFVRRFLGPVDMLIITLDKLLPWLDSMQCTTLN